MAELILVAGTNSTTHCLLLGMMPAPLKEPYLQIGKVIFTDSYGPRPRDTAQVNECMVHECYQG